MAAPLISMEYDRFLALVEKAKFQAKYQNHKDYDVDAMALMLGCLNYRYRNQKVYFALLGAGEYDISNFPATDTHMETYLFHQHKGRWSVAFLGPARPPLRVEVRMFDGISDTLGEPGRLAQDSVRRERLDALKTAVARCLPELGVPASANTSFTDGMLYCHGDENLSGLFCLMWAEAMFKNWVYPPNADYSDHPAWGPWADDEYEWARMTDIETEIDWTKVLELRAEWAKHNFYHLTGTPRPPRQ